MVLSNAMLGLRESRRVCCTMIGTLETIREAYEVSRGMGGSLKSLNRRWRVRLAPTVTR